MSTLEDAIQRTALSGKPSLILCDSEKSQESVRVMLYHAKRKNPLGDSLGITKIEKGGKLYAKVFKRPLIMLFTENESGEIIPMEDNILDHPELRRIVSWMEKDGKSKEEIQQAVKYFKENYEKDWSEESTEKADVIAGINRNKEKELMKEVKLKKDLEASGEKYDKLRDIFEKVEGNYVIREEV